MVLKDVSLRLRLVAVISFLSLLAIGIGALGLYGMAKSTEGQKSVYEGSAALEQIFMIDNLLVQSQLSLSDALLDPTEENTQLQIKLIEKNIANESGIWQTYLSRNITAAEKAITDKLSSDRAKMLNDGQRPAIHALNSDTVLAKQLKQKTE